MPLGYSRRKKLTVKQITVKPKVSKEEGETFI